jgi:5-methyltetrahydrofolate--homocysteine methyltransferase
MVSDGAMGTILMEAGLAAGECPEAMVFRDPGAIRGVAQAYIEAGADVVHTCTFGGSALKLEAAGLSERVSEVNAGAVELARDACAGRAHVSVSVGPCGRLLEPYGDVTEDHVFESFVQQLAPALAAGADLVTVETMIDAREAVLAIRAAKSVSGRIPVIATMTFNPTPRGFRTMMGTTIDEAARILAHAGADVVGSNCGNGISVMVDVARAFRTATELPLIIQANAGVPEVADGKVRYPETPEDFAAAVPGLLRAGVSILGGCCGTRPAHVSAFRDALDAS